MLRPINVDLQATERSAHHLQKPLICLSMITKNEQAVIKACLNSVRSLVDRYAIVDTGSTDLTLDLARQILTECKGRILRRKWRHDFARHRNEALQLAQDQLADSAGGVVLFIDADERLLGLTAESAREFRLKESEALWIYARDEEYRFLKLIAASSNACLRWQGELHEQLTFQEPTSFRIARSVQLCYGQQGHRRLNAQTLQGDMSQLQRTIAREAPGYRTLYFLARTFEASGIFEQAARYFDLANQHAADAEEVFQSSWGKLRALSHLREDAKACALATKIIAETQGQRAEPLVFLARLALSRGKANEAKVMALAALGCPLPWGSQMYDAGANGWKAYVTLAQAWHGRGKGRRSRHYWLKALSCPELTPAINRRIKMMMPRS